MDKFNDNDVGVVGFINLDKSFKSNAYAWGNLIWRNFVHRLSLDEKKYIDGDIE